MHDLGAHFPNLTGHPAGHDEYMPVEECGDMLIMGLSLVNSLFSSPSDRAQALSNLPTALPDLSDPSLASPFALATPSSDESSITHLDNPWRGSLSNASKGIRIWLTKTYPLWTQWTSYLVDYSLYPANQLSTDDFAGPLRLHTNLALKGIVGIKAMSELAAVLDLQDDVKYYRNISQVYVEKWQEYGMSRDGGRAKLAYDWYGSWTTLYSLFADGVLGFHPTLTSNSSSTNNNDSDDDTFVPDNAQFPLHASSAPRTKVRDFIPNIIYQTQSAWYHDALQHYGLPLDSRHLYSKLDWAFQAAAVASPSTRKSILDSVAMWVNESSIVDRPLTDLYFTEDDGGWPRGGPRFFCRPVVGSVFAFLALEGVSGGE